MKQYRILYHGGGRRKDLENAVNELAADGWRIVPSGASVALAGSSPSLEVVIVMEKEEVR